MSDYGDGAVFQRADGRWVADLPPARTGAARRIRVYGKTEKQAKDNRAKRLGEIHRNGAPVPGAEGRTTVRVWAPLWLERMKRKDRPKTWSDRQSVVNTWIVPTIGARRLDAITPADVRKVGDAVLAAGRSSSTARNAHRVLTKMLRDAIAEGYNIHPRALLADRPAAAVNDRSAIPLADALDILAVVVNRPDRSRWIAALLNGMRQGECLGLTWDCLAARTVDVSWQLQAVPYEHGCGPAERGKRPCSRRFGGNCPDRQQRIPQGYEVRRLDGAWCMVRPKTARGRRVIHVIDPLRDALESWRAIAPPSPHGLVWPRADGQPQRPDDDRDAWYALQDVAQVACVDGHIGRRYLLHEARHTTATLLLEQGRHTTATLLLEQGVDESVRIAILGHSTVTITRAYESIHSDLTRDALERVAARLQLG